MKLWIDTETRSSVPIKRGTYRYMTDVQLLTIQWAINAGPVYVLDLTEGNACQEVRFMNDVQTAFESGAEVWAHNAEFDRNSLKDCPLWLPFPLESWRCTAYLARLHGMPGGLDKLCEIFNLPAGDRKDKHGTDLINLFCVPRKDGKYNNRHTHPAEWASFLDYAAQDITAMRAIYVKIPHWNATDRMWKVWHLDQRMNEKGFAVDVDFAAKAVKVATRAKRKLADEAEELSHGAIESTTQVARLRAYLAEHGVDLPDLRADTVERRLEDENLPEHIKDLLRVRQQASKSSNTKYQRVLDCEVGGRLRGTVVCCGAQRTGRKSARLFQPHNLPRPKHTQTLIDFTIECIKGEHESDLSICDGTLPLASSALRGVIVAESGNRLVVADLANIEGRGTAWIAGEQWKLDAFRAYDTKTGPDLYKLAIMRAFARPEDWFDWKDEVAQWRQIGKVMELALGYGGGVGAFCSMADTYGLRLEQMAEAAWPTLPKELKEQAAEQFSEKRSYGLTGKVWMACWCLVQLWRGAHPSTSKFWKAIENAVRNSIRTSDKITRVGRLAVDRRGNWLRIRLPSERYLCYPAPRIGDDNLSFVGVNQYTKQWTRIPTYGGKLTENIVQALSLDVLDDWLVAADEADMRPVLSVHDEVVCEVPDDHDVNDRDLSKLVANCSPWASGLPLVAKGFTDVRYRKAA